MLGCQTPLLTKVNGLARQILHAAFSQHGAMLDRINQFGDVVGGLARAFSKLTHFVRHYGKPTASLAGTSGLNGSI